MLYNDRLTEQPQNLPFVQNITTERKQKYINVKTVKT
jgi:hypothetical protein